MSDGISAFGTALQIGNGGTPEAFTTIAEVINISGPTLSLETIDVTSHGSTDAWREFVAGLKDPGEITFDINFVPTGATHSYSTGLINDYDDRTLRNSSLFFQTAEVPHGLSRLS
jgi:hypothetical protein